MKFWKYMGIYLILRLAFHSIDVISGEITDNPDNIIMAIGFTLFMVADDIIQEIRKHKNN